MPFFWQLAEVYVCIIVAYKCVTTLVTGDVCTCLLAGMANELKRIKTENNTQKRERERDREREIEGETLSTVTACQPVVVVAVVVLSVHTSAKQKGIKKLGQASQIFPFKGQTLLVTSGLIIIIIVVVESTGLKIRQIIEYNRQRLLKSRLK